MQRAIKNFGALSTIPFKVEILIVIIDSRLHPEYPDLYQFRKVPMCRPIAILFATHLKIFLRKRSGLLLCRYLQLFVITIFEFILIVLLMATN